MDAPETVAYRNPSAEADHRARLAGWLRTWADHIEADEFANPPAALVLVTAHAGGHEIASVGLRDTDGLHTAGLALIRKDREARERRLSGK